MQHIMPITDQDHAWVQSVEIKEPEGMVKVDVYFGRCTCGQKFSGLSVEAITSQFLTHLKDVE